MKKFKWTDSLVKEYYNCLKQELSKSKLTPNQFMQRFKHNKSIEYSKKPKRRKSIILYIQDNNDLEFKFKPCIGIKLSYTKNWYTSIVKEYTFHIQDINSKSNTVYLVKNKDWYKLSDDILYELILEIYKSVIHYSPYPKKVNAGFTEIPNLKAKLNKLVQE